MIQFLSWISDRSSIHSIWTFASDVFMLTGNGVSKVQKKKKDFFSNLKTCSQVPLPEQKARLHYLLLFTRLCWANVSKWIKLFAITWVITALCYTEVSQLFSNCKLVHPALGCCKCSLLTVTDVKVRSGEMTTVRLSVCPGFPWYCFVL